MRRQKYKTVWRVEGDRPAIPAGGKNDNIPKNAIFVTATKKMAEGWRIFLEYEEGCVKDRLVRLRVKRIRSVSTGKPVKNFPPAMFGWKDVPMLQAIVLPEDIVDREEVSWDD